MKGLGGRETNDPSSDTNYLLADMLTLMKLSTNQRPSACQQGVTLALGRVNDNMEVKVGLDLNA